MKKPYLTSTSDEPVGIVISRGSRDEPTPMFVSYVWESIPESDARSSGNASRAA